MALKFTTLQVGIIMTSSQRTLTWKGNSGHTNRYIATKKEEEKNSLAESLRMIMNQ